MQFNTFAAGMGALILLTYRAQAEVKTTLDPGVYSSARGGALAGAISCTANGLDASFYNPALIGGLTAGKTNVRNLHLPYLGASLNKNAANLNHSFQSSAGEEDPVIGEAIVNANSGKRQFARLSLGSDIEWKRMLVNSFFDLQAAALSPTDLSPDMATGYTMISAKYKQTLGMGGGMSWMNTRETFALGLYSAKVFVRYLDNALPYEILSNPAARKEYLNQNIGTYNGTYNHFGLYAKLPISTPTKFSLVARTPGSSKLQSTDPTKPDLKIREDWVSGLSVSPKLSTGILSLSFDISRLTEHHEALKSKVAGSVEFSLGGIGNDASFAFRLGANRAGISGGIALNFGLLNLDLASQATDIGDENDRFLERRTTVMMSLNLRDL